ncbi:histone-lysine N-methyltransferase SUV39H2-like [Homarus americanus]|uniref:Histone-lysine N-methyltransferase SUV39H2-like n=1 Tax=Homarus americanus TaxID=6706 RepID=A0A8J5N0E5_HOMAM|nr:histone-lysine N-methyltransferase SUV39H2-like [Homarus americanus]
MDEAQDKLNVCFNEFHEALNKTKQAFLVYKTKSFFFSDAEFTKSFAESLKRVEGELEAMGSSLRKLIGNQVGATNAQGKVSAPVVISKTETHMLHNASTDHTPEHSDTLVKTNGTASITPPVSEADNDDETLACVLDQGDHLQDVSGKIRLSLDKKRTHKKLSVSSSSFMAKRPRRSLFQPYKEQEEDLENSDIKEDVEYEVETIIDFKKSQGTYFYKVSWRGYGPDETTWEPSSNLTGCEELLIEFYKTRLREQENTKTDDLNYPVMPHDPSSQNLIHQALLEHIDHPSQEDYDNSIALFVSLKPPALKTQKEIHDLIERALSVKKKSRFNAIAKLLIEDKIMKESEGKRKKQLAELRMWERNINSICSDPAKLFVENFVDLTLPPMDFIYINECRAGEGVMIPSDPLVGCECTDCAVDHKSCCPKQMNSWFVYNKYGRLKVSLGTPIYECNNLCKCGPNCMNRVVQKGRSISLCIFRTANKRGWGVKTTENIKKDSLVTEYVGEVITSEEAERRGKIYDAQGCTYLFDLDYNRGDQNLYTVDAAKCGNVSHFINHSCDPNLVVFNVWVNCLDPDLPRLALFAARDIRKGEELTFDYNSGLKSEQIIDRPLSQSTEENEESVFTPVKGEGAKDTSSPELVLKTPKGNRGLQYGKTECHCGAANCRKYFF